MDQIGKAIIEKVTVTYGDDVVSVQQKCVRCGELKEVGPTKICSVCLPPSLLTQFENCTKCNKPKDINGPHRCPECTEEPVNLTWSFRYRAYKKQRAIQIKPAHDKTNHFSIIWTKNKKTISDEAFQEMDEGIRAYIANNGLTFRLIKACKNCTYGRFSDEFENLISQYRKKYDIYDGKDLPLDDPRHQHLKDTETWDADHPIVFHIHSKSSNNDWYEFMQSSQNSVLKLDIVFEPTE